jgi:hypothetical protein
VFKPKPFVFVQMPEATHLALKPKLTLQVSFSKQTGAVASVALSPHVTRDAFGADASFTPASPGFTQRTEGAAPMVGRESQKLPLGHVVPSQLHLSVFSVEPSVLPQSGGRNVSSEQIVAFVVPAVGRQKSH